MKIQKETVTYSGNPVREQKRREIIQGKTAEQLADEVIELQERVMKLEFELRQKDRELKELKG